MDDAHRMSELVWKMACQKGRYIKPILNPRRSEAIKMIPFWKERQINIGMPRLICNSDHHGPHHLSFPKSWIVL